MNLDELEMLIHRHLDGLATLEETSALNAELKSNAEAADLFVRMSTAEAALYSHFAEARGVAVVLLPTPHAQRPTPRAVWKWLAAAAAAAVVCSVAWWVFSNPPRDIAAPENKSGLRYQPSPPQLPREQYIGTPKLTPQP